MAPVFSSKASPVPIRVGLVILMSIIMVSVLNQPTLPLVESIWQLAGMAAKELLVGVVIGLMFRLLFMGIKTGGAILGYQIGFAMVSVPDVDSADQVSIIARFWFLLATLIFLSINGHHLVIGAMADSFQAIPAGMVTMPSSVGELIIKYTGYIFIIAVKVAAPVMVTLFLTDVSLGIIAKMMPTMNVFFVGFPIKIGVGLVVLAMSLPLFSYILGKSLHVLDNELRVLFAAWGEV